MNDATALQAGNSLIGHVASGAHGHGNGQGNSAAAAATSETTTNMCLGIRLRLLLRLLTIDRCAPRPQKHVCGRDRAGSVAGMVPLWSPAYWTVEGKAPTSRAACPGRSGAPRGSA